MVWDSMGYLFEIIKDSGLPSFGSDYKIRHVFQVMWRIDHNRLIKFHFCIKHTVHIIKPWNLKVKRPYKSLLETRFSFFIIFLALKLCH